MPAASTGKSTRPKSRGAAWQTRRGERLAGALEKYARLVGPANQGAVTHSGAVDWLHGV